MDFPSFMSGIGATLLLELVGVFIIVFKEWNK